MFAGLAGWIRGATLGAVAAAGLAGTVQAQDRPVVLELYTSQGCSSCPPADELLRTLADRDDVIALALHVDYWDYIGWKDVFATPRYSKRQKAYARNAGRRTVYTPQMIVQGQEDVVGTHPMDVSDLIIKHLRSGRRVELDLSRAGSGKVAIEAEATADLQAPLVVQIVRYKPSARVDVLRGENAGRTLAYSNIVTDWQILGEWDTRQPLSMTADAQGEDPVVVLIQQKGPGAIEAAARLR